MGSLSDYLRRPSSPKAALGGDDTAWPYRVVHTNDPETLAPHEEQEADAQHRHPPGLKPLLSTGDGIAQHMHTRHRLGAANTDSAYYTFWQQILGDTEGTISNAYLTSRAITHAQRRTVLSIGMVSCGTTSWHSGTNSATPTNAHCATKLTEAATSPQVAKTPS
jgi:hypothetical protein